MNKNKERKRKIKKDKKEKKNCFTPILPDVKGSMTEGSAEWKETVVLYNCG